MVMGREIRGVTFLTSRAAVPASGPARASLQRRIVKQRRKDRADVAAPPGQARKERQQLSFPKSKPPPASPPSLALGSQIQSRAALGKGEKMSFAS